MAGWSGKSRGTVAGYRILIFILKKFGRHPVYIVLYPVVFYYFLFSPKNSRAVYRYFREIHKRSVLDSLIGIYRSYYALAVSLVDKVAIYSLENPGFSFAFDGEHNLRNFTQCGSGGVFLTGHLGNWEIAGFFLKKYDCMVHLVGIDIENSEIRNLLSQTMVKKQEVQHLKYITMKENSMEHLFRINEALAQKEFVCFTADRFVEGQKTITRNFLGKPARFPLGPFQLAAATKSPVTMTFGFKVSADQYQLYGIAPLFYTDGESKNEYLEKVIRFYIDNLENMIRKYPEQWFNFYEFWEL